ncbi:BgTH12-04432 [Blumeria graminis f. sp. triticale]|uniref:Bgt-2464 n=3 Tax=Blumeria graminis TaxID=34373 RepID=A0A061HGX9_BLUGR|nr:hypothetical protein BGT96224_2464 [Blumeria graminis f. sp. tritici 96224]CAD6498772.1 BgTH12-04432 [Blumeria graminis f. sp. triticale]VCU38887.1 Bgt-2464 [Blumeria graminis f. sp. tritici]
MQEYRAHSLFQPSNLSKALTMTLDDSGCSISHIHGVTLSIPHTEMARIVSVLGYDFVMVDASHTAIDPETLVQLIRTINFCSEGRTVAVVRVPSARSDLLTYSLDAGAAGIIFPHIDTPEEAAEAVRVTRYAYSGGERSLSPFTLLPGITDLAPGSSHELVADAHVAVICQIESAIAVKNVEAIASVPGIDCLMLGIKDLRVTLGVPSQRTGDMEDPKVAEAVNQLVRAGQKFKKPLMAAAFNGSKQPDQWVENFSMLLSGLDVTVLSNKLVADLSDVKEFLEHQKVGKNKG